jgi:DNA-binding NtrC family response regulator
MAGTPNTLPESEDGDHPPPSVPHLFVVLHAHAPLDPPSRHRLDGVSLVTLGRGNSGDGGEHASWNRSGGRAATLALHFADPRCSQAHARISKVLSQYVIEDLGSRNGTLVNGAKIERANLEDGDLVEVGHTFLIYRELPADPDAPADTIARESNLPGHATLLPDLAAELDKLARVARTRESVLVVGETGTGKELAARAVHDGSGRRGDFVAVNCAALPEAMVEAELFGHRRGAFSGAVADRLGLVRAADKGTLFLDEIGDLRLSSQAALLRVLQEHQVTPVGAEKPVDVDLRVVCATHRSLESLVESGGFRADLLARLRGFTFELPPLRARREDLGLIVAALLRDKHADGAGSVRLSAAAARTLLTVEWPHNVRELEKALGAAIALAGGEVVRREHVPQPSREAVAAPARPVDRELVEGLLREHRGNISAVARALGKGRTQVHRYLERFGIDPVRFRT